MTALLTLGLALAPLRAQDPAPDEEKLWASAMEKFEQANRSSEPKVQEQLYLDVVALFRQITEHHPDSKRFGVVTYNVGVVLSTCLEGREAEAIREFRKLIESDVDDMDSTGQLMWPYRNYRYCAWGQIATCEWRLEHPGKALDALYAMRRAFVSHCGTCMEGMESGFQKRAKSLCVKIVEGPRKPDPKPEKPGEPEPDPDEVLVDSVWAAHGESGAAELLLQLALVLHSDERVEDARRVARVIWADLPKSAAATEAKRLLER